MKRAVIIILAAILVLAGLAYAVGYSCVLFSRTGNLNFENRKAGIAALCSQKREGPDLFRLKSVWMSAGELRLDKCRAELLHWRTKIVERVNAI